MDREKIVAGLLDAVVANRVTDGGLYLDPDVKLYLDEIESFGIKKWARWVQYLHLQPGHIISLKISEWIHEEKDTIRVKGWLIYQTESGTIRENDVLLTYVFKGDKIIRACSRRRNYTSILGKSFAWKPMILWHGLRMMIYTWQGKL